MLTFALALLFFAPIVVVIAAIEALFTPDELAKMGVRLENPRP